MGERLLKTLLLVVGGLAAGLAIAYWLPSSEPTPPLGAASPSTSVPRSVSSDVELRGARHTALEDALAAEVEQRVALEKRVADLAAELQSSGARSVAAESGTHSPDPGDNAQMRTRFREGEAPGGANERRIVEQLIAGGFAPDRAAWINRRSQELRMQSLQAQYEAMRQGRGFPAGNAQGNEAILRNELGDAEYERYLAAMGRPTTVGVRDDVLASSPAERSGLLPGDEIVAYDGKRVFDMRELNALTLEGTAGESVIVDVRRSDQNVQLLMPRGPIGIFGGGFRGR